MFSFLYLINVFCFLKFTSNQVDESEIFFISALRDIKFNKILNFSFNINNNLHKRISTVELNKWLHKIVKLNSPSRIKRYYQLPD